MNIYGYSNHGAKKKTGDGRRNTLIYSNSKDIILNLEPYVNIKSKMYLICRHSFQKGKQVS